MPQSFGTEGLSQMATDERRRKVAAELRELAANRRYVDEFIAADTVGFWRGEATEGFDSDSLLEVADLIDRPVYRPVIPNAMEGYVFCPQCGAPIGEYGVPNYCHSCGVAIRNGH